MHHQAYAHLVKDLNRARIKAEHLPKQAQFHALESNEKTRQLLTNRPNGLH